ncbi:hypothetical protein CHS0354_014747 [Potamilus streckersoni]|uniref:Uncharacterized protein n=1 Tax=Potamilus streckersoni TaxID=2493646 RepID=A0AAE0VZI2_9BIVA|nr:hypothetical protein CHS0354_014747 [Potamilus streckersoni]
MGPIRPVPKLPIWLYGTENNVKFYGFTKPNDHKTWEQCDEKIKTYLRDILEKTKIYMRDVLEKITNQVQIDRIHRIGRGTNLCLIGTGRILRVQERGGFDSVPQHGGFDRVSKRGGFDSVPQHGGFDRVPKRGGFDSVPQHGGFDRVPKRGGFDSVSQHGGFDRVPKRGGFDSVPQHGGFDSVPQRWRHINIQ